MKKKRINKLSRIPIGIYCYKWTNTFVLCPFYTHKKTDFGTKEKKRNAEYCKLLHKYLSIQDTVKDCNINRGTDD